jgi:hypothetical protein
MPRPIAPPPSRWGRLKKTVRRRIKNGFIGFILAERTFPGVRLAWAIGYHRLLGFPPIALHPNRHLGNIEPNPRGSIIF